MLPEIKLKRAYDASSPEDGFRIYVDRLWPRGLSHETFHYDLWDKDISPSTELREWFHQDSEGRWNEFSKKYMEELSKNPSIQSLKSLISDKKIVTLLYSSHDSLHNNAVVLKEFLEK